MLTQVLLLCGRFVNTCVNMVVFPRELPQVLLLCGKFVNTCVNEGKRKRLSFQTAFSFGAGYEIRTRDFHLGKVTLYH